MINACFCGMIFYTTNAQFERSVETITLGQLKPLLPYNLRLRNRETTFCEVSISKSVQHIVCQRGERQTQLNGNEATAAWLVLHGVCSWEVILLQTISQNAVCKLARNLEHKISITISLHEVLIHWLGMYCNDLTGEMYSCGNIVQHNLHILTSFLVRV